MIWKVALALLLTSCGPGGGEVTGLVIDMEGDLTRVERFTVMADGVEYTFVPTADGRYAFALPHLREHLRSSEPVTVGYVEFEGVLQATSVSDD